MIKSISALIVFSLFFLPKNSDAQIVLDSIADGSGYTYTAAPMGNGPFPAVLYNHGGFGFMVGGDHRQTVIALAQAGYIARAEKRSETNTIGGHL